MSINGSRTDPTCEYDVMIDGTGKIHDPDGKKRKSDNTERSCSVLFKATAASTNRSSTNALNT